MKFVLPCLLFLSFPAYADVAAPASDAPCAEERAIPERTDCEGGMSCEFLQESEGGASRVEVVTPVDAPEGYDEQIYILE